MASGMLAKIVGILSIYTWASMDSLRRLIWVNAKQIIERMVTKKDNQGYIISDEL